LSWLAAIWPSIRTVVGHGRPCPTLRVGPHCFQKKDNAQTFLKLQNIPPAKHVCLLLDTSYFCKSPRSAAASAAHFMNGCDVPAGADAPRKDPRITPGGITRPCRILVLKQSSSGIRDYRLLMMRHRRARLVCGIRKPYMARQNSPKWGAAEPWVHPIHRKEP
jgi:hypothetical protein